MHEEPRPHPESAASSVGEFPRVGGAPGMKSVRSHACLLHSTGGSALVSNEPHPSVIKRRKSTALSFSLQRTDSTIVDELFPLI